MLLLLLNIDGKYSNNTHINTFLFIPFSMSFVYSQLVNDFFFSFLLFVFAYFHNKLFSFFIGIFRRKTSQLKYEPPYSKKPNLSKYTNPGNMTHPGEEMPMDGSNKLIFTNPSLMG
jgi:hypothetical protein